MRIQGEEFSLQTEIVLLANCKTLYEEQNNVKMGLAKNFLSKLFTKELESTDHNKDEKETPYSYDYSSSFSSSRS